MWSSDKSDDASASLPSNVKVITTNGFRYVVPYDRRFHAFIKKRWFGKTLFEVLCSEFTVNTPDYYRSALSDGRVRLNGEIIGDEPILLKNNDFFTHIVHCHEPPVFDVEDDLEILTHIDQHPQPEQQQQTDQQQQQQAIPQDAIESLVVVNKPASMPVHPCGRYNHNSLLSIVKRKLEQQQQQQQQQQQASSLSTPSSSTTSSSTSAPSTPESLSSSSRPVSSLSLLHQQQLQNPHRQYKKRRNKGKEDNSDANSIELYPIHRLDRVTSGLVIFARDKKNATLMGKLLTSRDVEKIYLAKVVGRFPGEESDPKEDHINDDSNKESLEKDVVDEDVAGDDDRGLITVDAPILAKLKYAEEGFDSEDDEEGGGGDTPRNNLKGVIVHPKGQEAKTVFKRLSYDPVSDTSVVKCWPKTGRTHQIRVHLAHLGHPIVDDPHYNPVLAERRLKRRRLLKSLDEGNRTMDQLNDEEKELLKGRVSNLNWSDYVKDYKTTDSMKDCPYCIKEHDLFVDEMMISLHSLCYSIKSKGWTFQTAFPRWAKPSPSPSRRASTSSTTSSTS